MTRIVAGAARGRRLAVPPGQDTRPTSDRAREALFSSLESLLGAWASRRVIDLYAGSGAVGLEALSRGAAHALLVESDPKAVRAIQTNVATLGLPGAEVRHTRAERLAPETLTGGTYDVLYADPPYELADADLADVLARLRPVLAEDAVVVVERSSHGGPWSFPPAYEALRSRRYGEATLWYGRATAVPGRTEES